MWIYAQWRKHTFSHLFFVLFFCFLNAGQTRESSSYIYVRLDSPYYSSGERKLSPPRVISKTHTHTRKTGESSALITICLRETSNIKPGRFAELKYIPIHTERKNKKMRSPINSRKFGTRALSSDPEVAYVYFSLCVYSGAGGIESKLSKIDIGTYK